MKPVLRKIRKTTYWILVVFVLLVILDIAILAFPQPLFPHKIEYGNFSFYSDKEFSAELDSVAREIGRRLESIEIFDPEVELRAFLCQSPKLYKLFARLTLVPPVVPGFNLSVLNNSFVSIPGIEERYYRNSGFPKYSAIGGGLVQNIGHELVHDYFQETIGFFNYRNLPPWKTEGYAEYGASIGASRSDSIATLESRISDTRIGRLDFRGREYYSWALTMEFLAEKQGLKFVEIMNDSIKFDDSYERMMSWYEITEKKKVP